MQKIVIFGAGGFAREVLQIVHDINREGARWQCLGFLVDPEHAHEATIHGLPVLGGLEWLTGKADVYLALGVGNSRFRRRIAMRLEHFQNHMATLVHPRAWLGEAVSLDEGCVICAGALVTTDIRLGRHVHVNLGCTICHDSILEDFVTLNPGVNVSGNVRIATGSEVGTGAKLIPGVSVGQWSIVGAGAVVTRPLPENCTAVGMPASVIKTRQPGWHET